MTIMGLSSALVDDREAAALQEPLPAALDQLVVITGAGALILERARLLIDFGNIDAGVGAIAIDLDRADADQEAQLRITRHCLAPQLHDGVPALHDAELGIMRQVPMAVLDPQRRPEPFIDTIDSVRIG